MRSGRTGRVEGIGELKSIARGWFRATTGRQLRP